MEKQCLQCPRACRVDRAAGERGFCGANDALRVARISLHLWEEPSICGKNGAGTVFFSGCNLRCVYCQNYELSHRALGRSITAAELEREILSLQESGAQSIDLVTPTPYLTQLIPVLQRVKPHLHIPVVYNCGGYESVTALNQLEGLIDVYLPDFKYASSALAKAYSGAEDYPSVALDAIAEMLRQVGKCTFDENGMLLRGVIVRHLVLPGARNESIRALQLLEQRFGSDAFLLSLMSQYTPIFAKNAPFPSLHRRVTSFEYDAVLKEAEALGFDGYFQARSSASEDYTPQFEGDPL